MSDGDVDVGTVTQVPGDGSEAADLFAFCRELYPILRSITGEGLRQTLRLIGERIPLQLQEVASGTPVFDWTVPREWNVRQAWVADAAGRRVIDFERHNLHVLNYSTPIRGRMPLAELRPHLHTLPDHPDWIPYRTSYYKDAWGFCLTQRQLDALPDGEYDVCIDSTLAPGSLTMGEFVLPGDGDESVLISTHVCHPSLANDNLSGIAVATRLAQRLMARTRRRYTYRFVFVPGTIGAITWLATHEAETATIRHGLVLSGVGDHGPIHFKRSRRGNTTIDRAARHVLAASGRPHTVLPFSPYGYDERQYCSPGFDLAVGCLMRTPFGQYPQYHTSADNLSLLSPHALADSLAVCESIVDVLEGDARYRNLNPKCEPQLGKRGLYNQTGGQNQTRDFQMALLWVLSYSDGEHSLLDIAENSGVAFPSLRAAATALLDAGLLAPA